MSMIEIINKAVTPEDFLYKRVPFLVDFNLPFRLQKKQLLERLGLPLDRERLVLENNRENVSFALNEFKQKKLYVIVTSAIPHPDSPIFYKVEDEGNVLKRYNRQWSSLSRSNLLEDLISHQEVKWLEFSTNLWDFDVYAGRLLFVNIKNQVLELQKGVTPNELGDAKFLYDYAKINMSFFDPFFDGSENSSKLICLHDLHNNSHINVNLIRNVAEILSKYINQINFLSKLSKLPTLEFAYKPSNKVVFIDIDWPEQYVKL